MSSYEDLHHNSLTSPRLLYSNFNNLDDNFNGKMIERMRSMELNPKYKKAPSPKYTNRNDFDYEDNDEEIWFKESDLYLHHLNEIYDKYDEIDDDIWCKIICMERNKRVAKAYVRVPVVTINGSYEGFDGLRIGLGAFENSSRDSHVANIKTQIAQGLKIKLDKDGSILAKRISKHRMIYIKGSNRADVNCFSDDIYYNEGLLEYEKPTKIFDMKLFKDKISMAIQQPNLIKYLQFMAIISISFVEDHINPLMTPCWIMIINIAALDILKDMKLITPLIVKSSPYHHMKPQDNNRDGNAKNKGTRKSLPIIERNNHQAVFEERQFFEDNIGNNLRNNNLTHKKFYRTQMIPHDFLHYDNGGCKPLEYQSSNEIYDGGHKIRQNKMATNFNHKFAKDRGENKFINSNNDDRDRISLKQNYYNDEKLKKTRSSLSLDGRKISDMSNDRYFDEGSDNILVLPAHVFSSKNNIETSSIHEQDFEFNDSGNCDGPDHFSSSQDFNDPQIKLMKKEKFSKNLHRGSAAKKFVAPKYFNGAPTYCDYSSNNSSENFRTLDDKLYRCVAPCNRDDLKFLKDSEMHRGNYNHPPNLSKSSKLIEQNYQRNLRRKGDYEFFNYKQRQLNKDCSEGNLHKPRPNCCARNQSLSSQSSANEYPFSLSPKSSVNLVEELYDDIDSINNHYVTTNGRSELYNSNLEALGISSASLSNNRRQSELRNRGKNVLQNFISSSYYDGFD